LSIFIVTLIFVREGYQMIGNTDANTFTAYDARGHTLVIVATNSTTGSTAVTYNLSHFHHVGAAATPYQTTASENLQRLPPITLSHQLLTSSLPPRSITTFVVPDVFSS
jgi:O-glycosyl hydrolase